MQKIDYFLKFRHPLESDQIPNLHLFHCGKTQITFIILYKIMKESGYRFKGMKAELMKINQLKSKVDYENEKGKLKRIFKEWFHKKPEHIIKKCC